MEERSFFRKAVKDYLEMRRALGYKINKAAVLLPQFVNFLRQQGASVITIPLALQWAQSNKRVQPAEWAQRLTIVRCFARHWSATDPRTQIPPWGLLPHRPKRKRPYLYSDEEVQQLLQSARRLGGLRGPTYRTRSNRRGFWGAGGDASKTNPPVQDPGCHRTGSYSPGASVGM
ncbi:MAG: hypothetical protein FJW35_10135 [Acidobacteria bacterium]|nr:hypothetical protein [Acidobacteriota bacterium]